MAISTPLTGNSIVFLEETAATRKQMYRIFEQFLWVCNQNTLEKNSGAAAVAVIVADYSLNAV